MVQAAGVGSIWNKGNWHWEEKNYTEFAKEYLTKVWCVIKTNKAEADIEIYEVKELTGSASVTIRKQKQTPMFEFEGELYWKAKCTKAIDTHSAIQGKIKLFEFNQEDDELQVEVTCGTEGVWADQVKRAIKNDVSQMILDQALTLMTALKSKDIDEERLAKARANEADAANAYEEAQATSGLAKLVIAQQAKDKEEEMKRAEAMKPKPIVQQINSAAAPQQVIAGTGSVWNTNSYHWEEKSVNTWATDTLRKVLSGFTHTMQDSTLTVSEITTLTGEASVSIRKGKKIISFDYQVVLKWKIVLADADGNSVSQVEGKYEMPEICNDDDWDEWEVRVEYGEDPDNLRAMLDQMVRTFAPQALKLAINNDFVGPLKLK